MAMTASISSLVSSSLRQCRYSSGPAEAMRSTGLAVEASGDSTCRNLACSSGPNSGSVNPLDSRASAARMPGPPALVTTPTRRPSGIGWLASTADTSNSSSRVEVRITPAWWNRASTATSMLARAPVWLLAARVPAAVRPDFTATMGLRRAMRRAIRAKRRGLPKDSR